MFKVKDKENGKIYTVYSVKVSEGYHELYDPNNDEKKHCCWNPIQFLMYDFEECPNEWYWVYAYYFEPISSNESE